MDSPVTTARPESPQQVLRTCIEAVKTKLPAGWTFAKPGDVEVNSIPAGATFQITDPPGTSCNIIIEAKRTVERRDIGRIRDQLDDAARKLGGTARGMVAARYLSPQVRADLERFNLAYVDATGNMRIALDRPAIFLSAHVTDRDPWRGPGRPSGSLKGEPASRIVRTLLEYQRPLTISDILKFSGASTGATYRVRNHLTELGLIERLPNSTYQVQDWEKLLRAWAIDYALPPTSTQTFLAPRGVEWLRKKIAHGKGFRYAVTGSLAAEQWAPYAPTKLARIYVDDTTAAAEHLELHPTEVGQNVLLVEPQSPNSFVFENTWTAQDGVALAAPVQVAVDLLNGPGRNPSEGEALIEWMAANENAWRK